MYNELAQNLVSWMALFAVMIATAVYFKRAIVRLVIPYGLIFLAMTAEEHALNVLGGCFLFGYTVYLITSKPRKKPA